jgi:hypothetical protein
VGGGSISWLLFSRALLVFFEDFPFRQIFFLFLLSGKVTLIDSLCPPIRTSKGEEERRRRLITRRAPILLTTPKNKNKIKI